MPIASASVEGALEETHLLMRSQQEGLKQWLEAAEVYARHFTALTSV